MKIEKATIDVWVGAKICPAGSFVPIPFRVVLLGVEHCWSALRGLALTLRLLVESAERISRDANKRKNRGRVPKRLMIEFDLPRVDMPYRWTDVFSNKKRLFYFFHSTTRQPVLECEIKDRGFRLFTNACQTADLLLKRDRKYGRFNNQTVTTDIRAC